MEMKETSTMRPESTINRDLRDTTDVFHAIRVCKAQSLFNPCRTLSPSKR